MITAKEKINKIRELMSKDGVSYYLIDTNDPHLSEYISDYYKEREYISGFTGSNGILLIGLNNSYLWTDGRYFVQAENELLGSDIILMKMGQKNVPTLSEFIKENLSSKDVLAFNGSLISAELGISLTEIIRTKGAKYNSNIDYCNDIWIDRPIDSAEVIYTLNSDITGKDSSLKIKELREELLKQNVDCHFITKLDDIMWLYNIRGNDIECNPVAYSYTLIKKNEAYIYLKETSLTDTVKEYFEKLNINILDYNEIGNICSLICDTETVLLDKHDSNYNIYSLFNDMCTVVQGNSPVVLWKAIKNDVEISNSKNCYLNDSVVLTKFIIWLKEAVKTNDITECEAAKKLDDMRAKIAGFIELSFPTISAYGPNAAMMHYEATSGKDSLLKQEGIYLVDSGATYYNGTTDVTRSIVLGPVTEEMKKHFSLALIGMLRLQNAVFYKGATGRNLDILARMPLWNIGIDYKCGTGHGVGYILNVHEGPQSIRTLRRKNEEETSIVPGMIISDEPGVYIAGSHGIRHENILLCKEHMSNEDGDFLCFEALTLVPVDLEGIDKSYFNDDDISMLNSYHNNVYEKLSPFFSGKELEALKEMTRPI